MNEAFKKRMILFRQWLSGDTSRGEERSLEQMSDDDPFLADAMEGYRRFPEEDHAEAVIRMKANLRRRHADRRRRGAVFYMTRIAAVGVVLLAAWLVFRSFGPAQDNAVAESMEQTASEPTFDQNIEAKSILTDTSAQEALLSQKEPVEPAAPISKEAPVGKDDLPPPPASPHETEDDAVIAANEPAPVPDTPMLVLDGIALAEPQAKKADERSEHEAAEKAGKARSRNQASERQAESLTYAPPAAAAKPEMDMMEDVATVQVIHGVVTDMDGEPLIGVNITVKGTIQGTLTDIDGTFTIEPKLTEPVLVISYTGYSNREVVVGAAEYLEINLSSAGEELSEVVITGLRTYRKAKTDAKPRGGFRKFEKYIEKNMRRPGKVAGGKVVVQFDIDEDGRAVNVEIQQSDCPACNEEAIRLLEEGPGWKPAPGYQATYTLRF